jgi:hypothetical protein
MIVQRAGIVFTAPRLAVQDVGAVDPVRGRRRSLRAVIRSMAMCHSSTWILGWALDLPDQGVLDRAAGGVGGMDDAAVAMAAFPGEVELVLVVAVPGEGHPLGDQPLPPTAPALDHEATASSWQRPPPATWVSRMWSSRESEPSRTAAIPPWAQLEAPSEELVLGDQGHPAGLGQAQRGRTCRPAAADDQDVAGVYRGWCRIVGQVE